MSYIEITDIEKSFANQEILKKINISIQKGEFITLLGPSGCGKTTLLRSIAGLEPIDGGSISVEGKEITNLAPNQRNVGMVFQQYSLFPTMTVYDNISYGLKMKKVKKVEIEKSVDDMLEIIDMKDCKNKYPSQLSGGEQQRVAIARSMITNPKVMLMDEPFSSIDAKLRKLLQIRIKNIHKRLNMTTIFVTHDQEEAIRLSDRIYLFNEGNIEQEGTPMDIYCNPKTPFVAGFIGSYNILSKTEFNTLIGNNEILADSVFLKPEVINIRKNESHYEENVYTFKAKIKNVLYQGNIIRYEVVKNDISINIDVLYHNNSYAEEDEVWISFNKKDLISYKQ